MTVLPAGPFGCILADPPWAFKTYSRPRGAVPQRRNDSGAEDHYPVMATAGIARIPVGDVAARDCALFMWVVDSHLPDAFELAAAWGFSFKTRAFTWLKETENGRQLDIFHGESDPRIGMGYWTRKQTEMCWLFTRGKPRRLDKGVREVIRDRRREHSRKPDETHDRIERLVAGPYLELFAREPREGWTVWGNQTDKFARAA